MRDGAQGVAKKGPTSVPWQQGPESGRTSGGFNHSVRYKQHVVHVQTEDSGPRHGAVVTHVFVGGRVIGRRHASYAERLGAPDLATFVGKLVYAEHRAAFRALRDGEFDEALGRLPVGIDEGRASGVVRTAVAVAGVSLSSKPPAAPASPSAPPAAVARLAGPPVPVARRTASPPRPAPTPAEAPFGPPTLPSLEPTVAAAPPAPVGRAAPSAALSPALRSLEGYRASGLVDAASGALVAADGPTSTGALVAGLLAVAARHEGAPADLGADGVGELLLLGQAGCLLARPVPARAGLFVYVACDRSPTNVARARLALNAAAEAAR
jgi:hypothetical protein